MDRRESDLSSFARLKANRQIWTDRSSAGQPPLPTIPQIYLFPLFLSREKIRHKIYSRDVRRLAKEKEKKKERYAHTHPNKYREILWYSGCGTLPCPDRGQLTKSVKWWIDERFNLSRGANPCYRDISIIGGEGDIRGWPVFQTDNRRYAVAGR